MKDEMGEACSTQINKKQQVKLQFSSGYNKGKENINILNRIVGSISSI
jgi:hypothetical protein